MHMKIQCGVLHMMAHTPMVGPPPRFQVDPVALRSIAPDN